MNPFTRLRTARRDDAGISLVEVLVSITVLAITMAATGSGVIRSLQVARDSRESVLAANIAQFELERIRSIPFADWVIIAQDGADNTSTVSETGTGPNGQQYAITREIAWVAANAGDGCGSGEGADYVRVSQTVTIPGRDDIAPVENTTIITPRVTFFDPFSGNMVVFVRDRDGIGVPNTPVQVTGPAGLRTRNTDANGCAFFSRLAVDEDTRVAPYTVLVDRNGYVDLTTARQAAVRDVTVATQQTTSVEFDYDERSAFTLLPTLPAAPLVAGISDRRPTSACTMTLVTPYGGVTGRFGLECRNGANQAVPVNRPGRLPGEPSVWSAALPGLANGQNGLGYTIYQDTFPNDRISVSAEGQFTVPRPTTLADYRLPGEATTGPPRRFYPFTAGYQAHAGRCLSSAPGYDFPARNVDLGGNDPHLMAAEPGVTTTQAVEMATVSLYSADTASRTQTQGNRHMWAELRNTTSCPSGERLYLGQSNANGFLRAVVPFGEWVLYHTSTATPASGATPYSCDTESRVTNVVNLCLEVGADYRVQEGPADSSCPAGGGTQSWTGNVAGIGTRTITVTCNVQTFPATGFVYLVRPAP